MDLSTTSHPLDDMMADTTGTIRIIFECWKEAETPKQAKEYLERLEKLIREKLAESFERGREVGEKIGASVWIKPE